MPEPSALDLATSGAHGRTSFHVRKVVEQPDEDSWLWLVERLNPLLELQVAYRLRGAARNLCDPQDLLNDAWLVAFMRLHELRPRAGRWTPVLVEFLSTTLLHKINDLLRKEIRRRSLGAQSGVDDVQRSTPSELSDRLTSVVACAARSEVGSLLRASLELLNPAERAVVVLRGIEQRSNQEVATLLGLKPAAVAMRWARALARLRRALPEALVEDLTES